MRLLTGNLLEDYGCTVVGPCGTVESALAAVHTETFDLAVLDVNLRGLRVYPVAEWLAERQIPFRFLSGYGDEAIPLGCNTWKLCAKPFKISDLVAMLQQTLAAAVH